MDSLAKIPVNFVFSPNWWFHHYGVSFEEPFYLDTETRIRNDVLMRQALYDRFGLGRPDPQPRPVIGSRHIAGGFVARRFWASSPVSPATRRPGPCRSISTANRPSPCAFPTFVPPGRWMC